MGKFRWIKDFLSGFRETLAADRENPTASRLQWALVVTLVVILLALIGILIATI